MSTRVLINGAGIGGLALAHGLKKAGIPVIIFERDADLDSRTRPFAMRVTEDAKKALKTILSSDLYQELVRRSAEIGRDSLSKEGGATTLPAIDRGTLRKLLVSNLQENISYGKDLEKYTLTSTGVTAHFRDGSSESGSLLVGADGVHSRVRSLYLPTLKLVDTEGRLIWGKSPMTADARAALWKDVNNGVPDHVASGTTTLIVIPITFDRESQHVPDDYVYWVICSNKKDIGMTDEDFASLTQDQAAKLAIKLAEAVVFEGPSADLRKAMISAQDPKHNIIHTLYTATPDWYDNKWKPSAITLIGDAIHPLGMGAGGGAALKDAHELFQILQEGGDIRDNIGKYEEGMRERARTLLDMSVGRGQVLFGQPPFAQPIL